MSAFVFPDMVRSRVDGVPVFAQPLPEAPTSVLTFRVGYSDESFRLHGICHLVEHLALHSMHESEYLINGSVDSLFTRFMVRGTESEMVEFYSKLCAWLREPTFSDLDHERLVLQAESTGRQAGSAGWMLRTRYGPRGPGLVVCPELGVNTATAEELRSWVAQYFVAESASLWITGAVPADLRLALPRGTRASTVRPAHLPFSTPAALDVGDPHGIAISVVATDEPRLALLLAVAQTSLMTRLRHDLGIVYSIGVSVDRLSDDMEHATLLLQVNPEKSAEVMAETVAVMEGLMTDEGDAPVVKRVLDQLQSGTTTVSARTRWLDEVATSGLLGIPLDVSPDQRIANWKSTSASDVSQGWKRLWATALFFVSESSSAEASGIALIPDHHSEPVHGTRFKLKDLGKKSKEQKTWLVVSEHGVSVTSATQNTTTVRFDQCVGIVIPEVGPITLWGADNQNLTVDPNIWHDGPSAIAAIVNNAPGLTVGLPLSDAQKQAVTKKQGFVLRMLRRQRWFRMVMAGILLSLLTGNIQGRNRSDARMALASWVLSGIALVILAVGCSAVLLLRRTDAGWSTDRRTRTRAIVESVSLGAFGAICLLFGSEVIGALFGSLSSH